MRLMRKIQVLALMVAPVLGTASCRPNQGNIIVPLLLLASVAAAANGKAPPAKKPKKIKLKDKSDAQVSGSIGGLSGDYDLELENYGALTGTAEIKGLFKAKVRSDDDPDAYPVIEAALLDRLDLDVDVTLAKVKYNGKQAKGGAKRIFNLLIKYEGTVLSGEHAGKSVKGKLKLKGKDED